MRFQLRIPRLRLRLRTLAMLIAILAVSLWAGLIFWSPTRRLSRLLQADNPAYIRREAAAGIGFQVPPWEVEHALGILIDVCDDPSPRVRESAAVGLWQMGNRADRAAPKLVELMHDSDRYVRYAAAGTLGQIVGRESAHRAQVIPALEQALDDPDPEVGLSAADALTKMGEGQRAAGTLLARFSGADVHLRDRARLIMSRAGVDSRVFIPGLVAELRQNDVRRRADALAALGRIASPDVVLSALGRAAETGDQEVARLAKKCAERLSTNPESAP
jgi:HEAT repeat protein